MENYKEFLISVLSETNNKVRENILDNYFKIIDNLEFEKIIKDHEQYEDMTFMIQEKYNFEICNVIHNEEKKEILRDLIIGVKNKSIENNSQLKLLLPIIIFLDYKNILIDNIFNELEIIYKIKEFCVDFLENFEISIEIPEYIKSNSNENIAFNKYKEGLKKRDFINIYNFIEMLENSIYYIDNCFFRFCSYIMKNNYKDEYIEILNQKENILEIQLMISNLEESELIEVGNETSNFLVKFEVIRHFINDRTKQIENEEILLGLSSIIVDFSKDENIWTEFMKYYLRFPIKWPKFFIILGQVLKDINKKEIEIILKELKIDVHSSCKTLNIIKNTFTQENMKNLIGDSSKIIYDRWKNCIENSSDERVSIILTDAKDIVIFYIINKMSNDEFESMCKKYIKEVNEINNHWFKSSIKRMSYYNKKVSILFALGFRMNLEERKKLLRVFEKSCLVRDEDLNLIKKNWIG